MQSMILHDGPRYRLTRYGKGIAYQLQHKPAMRATYLQGDDASQFEADMEAIEASHPDWSSETMCAWLWDQCDYGSASFAD